ncbi:DUF4426 domain-containing protein [Vibrio sp. Of7-15]|uniref:DUF4426 domain-containing protein n=1 Tax=Vibrio sp. Of7-15 TaxID=2724879 RepID=UPI001EF18DBB|nr:DUF4426 domain-containing protein [Vibrio sp. Of7-15]MCG7499021.1 DUF4426 domain-containing protein [Vibrio sp. Of7-15]
MKKLFSLLVFLSLSFGVQAEQVKTIDSIDVHYSAFTSTFLTPEVAKAYRIKRSKYSAVLNISVLDNSDPEKSAVPANITGTAKNLVGQIKQLHFREIRDGNAIYYITEVPFTDQEDYTFKVKVAAGKKGNGEVRFDQKFYVD